MKISQIIPVNSGTVLYKTSINGKPFYQPIYQNNSPSFNKSDAAKIIVVEPEETDKNYEEMQQAQPLIEQQQLLP